MRTTLKYALIAAALVLVGQGCAPAMPPNPEAAPAQDAMRDGAKSDDAGMKDGDESGMEEGDEMKDGSAARMEAKGTYEDYSAGKASSAMKVGRAVVYYFWASWCPICKAEEPKVRSWIESSGLAVSGFRVNYDVESGLKSRYKIPYQHTAVVLNAKGEEVARFNGPFVQAEIQAALLKAAK